ncbi:acyl carrier protein [Streptomyces orinoci]|uniref:Phosphopantetheine-binding protein n=1 Tax=Streptomyces orinoci TaxID=67339 RepID=A0ABV3JZV6_STRON|nr:phosphopantetheine-binding protein [Streptomyces orinoci]
MQPDTETAVRENLSAVLTTEIAPEDLDPDLDMAGSYGLTSLNKVLFLTSVCEETGVDLGHFTEHDLAGMRTLRDVAAALSRYTDKAV